MSAQRAAERVGPRLRSDVDVAVDRAGDARRLRATASDRRAKAPKGDPYLAQVTKAFQLVANDDGLLLYTDWASPSMYTTLQNQFQLLLAGRQTPAGMAKAVQDDWTKFDKTLGS